MKSPYRPLLTPLSSLKDTKTARPGGRGYHQRVTRLLLAEIRQSSTPGVRVDITAVRDLDNDEWQAAKAAVTTLRDHFHRPAFAFVDHKFREFFETVSHHEQRLTQLGAVRIDFSGVTFDLTTRLAVWLLGFRLFLDHLETRLERNHGDQSDRFRAFKQLTGQLFDGRTAYRFMYNLRNYTHVELPGTVRMDQRLTDDGETKSTIELLLRRDVLLRNFRKWHRLVRPDLEALPAEFPVVPLIQDAHACLKEILIAQMWADLPSVVGAAEVLQPLLREIDDVEHCDPILYSVNDDGSPPQYSYIPKDYLPLVNRAAAGNFSFFNYAD